jgi:outer membrane protein OmpA-like peptidoglycan-associated protein
MHEPAAPADDGAVTDRTDLPRGFLNLAWPLAALALMLLMLLRACAPLATPAGPPAAFDSGAAAARANAAALAALAALPPQPEPEQVLPALNAIVVNFASGSDLVPVEDMEVLRAAAAVIAALPEGTRVVVTGHTDDIGSAAANLVLSRRRAEAVRAVLVERGAPAAALATHGAGASRPVADNRDEEGRFRNRRIEFALAS